MRSPCPVVLTNDDGIDAPGLRALATAIEAAWGEVPYIVAPDRCYSGCGQQVTMQGPIAVEERGPREYAIGGSPADCARLARMELVPECTLVLAGINHGGNMGHDIYLSGTVGAAREAAVLGVPAVAISQYLRGGLDVDWSQSARWAVATVQQILETNDTQTRLWNINLPHVDAGVTGEPEIVHCHPCSRALPVAFYRENGAYVYDGGRYHKRTQEVGTDVSACFGGSIAVSPLPVAPAGQSH